MQRELDKYEKEGNYEESIKLIDMMILENTSQTSSLLYRKAKALMHLEKYEQALTTLKVCLKECSNEKKFKVYIHMADCYSELEKDDESTECLEKALELEPENELLLKQLSYTAYINGNPKKCCEYIKKLIEIDKADIEDYTNMIFCCIQLEMLDDALKYAKKVIELDSGNIDAFATLTIIYDMIDDDEKLKEVCEEIISLKDDGTQQIILLKAQASLELGLEKEAFELVDKAIRSNPYDPFSYMMKGMLYNKLEKYDEADECFKEAFKLDPSLLLKINELK